MTQNQIFFNKWHLWLNLKLILYLFYYDYKTSYTFYINHASWHRSLSSSGLRVWGNRSPRRKLTCLTWWPPHMPPPSTEPGSQWWEASALPLRQPDLIDDISSSHNHIWSTIWIMIADRIQLSIQHWKHRK